MTTGSWNRSAPPGLTWTRSWSGADNPVPKTYSKPKYRKIRYADGTTVRFREVRPGLLEKPPKRARLVEHPYSMQEYYCRDPKVFYHIVGYPPGYVSDGRASAFGISMPHKMLLDSNDQLKLLGKLREKLSGSDFNMSVFLGESHQTIRMIGDTAIRIAKSYHHLRKGDFAGTARSLLEGTSRKPLKPYKEMRPFRPTVDAMSRHWLELQYGWKPLLKDVEGAAQAVAHALSVPCQQTYRMSVRKELNEFIPSPTTLVIDGGKPGVTQVYTHRRSLKVIVKEHPSVAAQLGLTNPELVAWELLPFSFVADWFIPIGQYLEARATVGNIVGTYVTSDFSISQQFFTSAGGLQNFEPSSYRMRYVVLDRTVTTSPKLPLPKFKGLKEALSVGHCLNGLALLAQAALKAVTGAERGAAVTAHDRLVLPSHQARDSIRGRKF